MNLKQLHDIATRFREALESLPNHELPVTLQNFPCGSCGDATLLLGTYLIEQGFPPFSYMLGERGERLEENWTSHAWLEREGIIIDITADQFLDKEDKVLIVQDSAWHALFCSEIRHVADYRIFERHMVAGLDRAYQKICSRLRET